MDRRGFITGLTALIVAPSIVRATNLMPVKVIDLYYTRFLAHYDIATDDMLLRIDRALFPLPEPKNIFKMTERQSLDYMKKIGIENPREIIDKYLQPKEGQQQNLTIPMRSAHIHIGPITVPTFKPWKEECPQS